MNRRLYTAPSFPSVTTSDMFLSADLYYQHSDSTYRLVQLPVSSIILFDYRKDEATQLIQTDTPPGVFISQDKFMLRLDIRATDSSIKKEAAYTDPYTQQVFHYTNEEIISNQLFQLRAIRLSSPRHDTIKLIEFPTKPISYSVTRQKQYYTDLNTNITVYKTEAHYIQISTINERRRYLEETEST